MPHQCSKPGSISGTRFAKAMTHYVLATITVERPRMGHRSWIDDLSQSARGSRPAIRRQLAACVIDTCIELQAKQQKVAPKSVILYSSFQDTMWVARKV